MSMQTKTLDSGIKDAPIIATGQATSQAGKDFAMTIALQKTEWRRMRGVTPLLFTLTDSTSGKKSSGVIFICQTDEIEADNENFTFTINGINIDKIVEDIAIAETSGINKKGSGNNNET
jgi:hypothetical protein